MDRALARDVRASPRGESDAPLGHPRCTDVAPAPSDSLDYQIEVEVTRFDVDTVGSAVLDARWWCSAGMARGSCGAVDWPSEPTQVSDYAAAAGALSRALGAMSLEIAQAIADQARIPR